MFNWVLALIIMLRDIYYCIWHGLPRPEFCYYNVIKLSSGQPACGANGTPAAFSFHGLPGGPAAEHRPAAVLFDSNTLNVNATLKISTPAILRSEGRLAGGKS